MGAVLAGLEYLFRDWFSRETFVALMRLRGVECRAADGFAEAFVARKLML